MLQLVSYAPDLHTARSPDRWLPSRGQIPCFQPASLHLVGCVFGLLTMGPSCSLVPGAVAHIMPSTGLIGTGKSDTYTRHQFE